MRSPVVLLVADLCHQLDSFTVEMFLNGDVCHTRVWRGAMPVFLARNWLRILTCRKFGNVAANILAEAEAHENEKLLSAASEIIAHDSPHLQSVKEPLLSLQYSNN